MLILKRTSKSRPTDKTNLTGDGGFQGAVGAQAVILKSETYNFHRLDLTRQAGFIVTIYDEDGLRLAATVPCSTPAEAFAEARRIVDGKVEGPKT
jgi:hypothetical protein